MKKVIFWNKRNVILIMILLSVTLAEYIFSNYFGDKDGEIQNYNISSMINKKIVSEKTTVVSPTLLKKLV